MKWPQLRRKILETTMDDDKQVQQHIEQLRDAGDDGAVPESERLDPQAGTAVATTDAHPSPGAVATLDPEHLVTDLYRDAWMKAEISLEEDEVEAMRELNYQRKRLRGIRRTLRSIRSAVASIDAPFEDAATAPAPVVEAAAPTADSITEPAAASKARAARKPTAEKTEQPAAA